MLLRLTAAILSLSAAACASIGPATVPHDRIDYASAIGNSWKEQTLLNIVKLRYGDMPIFLEVAQVIAGYQLQGTFGASFTPGNFNAAIVGPFTATGNATVIYQPLTGVDFLKRLMTPVPPSSVLFMLQSGYSADRIMPIMLDSINGLNNESNRLRRSADPKFTRLVELMREGQLAGAIQIRIERPKDSAESCAGARVGCRAGKGDARVGRYIRDSGAEGPAVAGAGYRWGARECLCQCGIR